MIRSPSRGDEVDEKDLVGETPELRELGAGIELVQAAKPARRPWGAGQTSPSRPTPESLRNRMPCCR